MTVTGSPGIGPSAEGVPTTQLRSLPPELNVFVNAAGSTPVEYAETLGEAYLSFARRKYRRSVGHYLTPAAVARFMADCSAYSVHRTCESLIREAGRGSCQRPCVKQSQGRATSRACMSMPTRQSHCWRTLPGEFLAVSQDWLSQRGVSLTCDVTERRLCLGDRSFPQVLDRGQLVRRQSRTALRVRPGDFQSALLQDRKGGPEGPCMVVGG